MEGEFVCYSRSAPALLSTPKSVPREASQGRGQPCRKTNRVMKWGFEPHDIRPLSGMGKEAGH